MLNPVKKGCQLYLYPVIEVKKDVRVLRKEVGRMFASYKERAERMFISCKGESDGVYIL